MTSEVAKKERPTAALAAMGRLLDEWRYFFACSAYLPLCQT